MSTAPFYGGIKEMLSSIAEKYPLIRFGALSNACGAYVRAVLSTNEVSDIFVMQLGADDVPAPKPHPDGLLYICEQMGGLDPSKCIYIGDSPTDGQAATAAGMKGANLLQLIYLFIRMYSCVLS